MEEFMKLRKFGIIGLVLAGLLTACPSPPSPTIASIAITGAPNDNNLKISAPVQLTATATDSSGATISNVAFNWVSSNPDAVSVDANGLVTAKKFGTATITASSGGINGTTASQTTYGLEATFGVWANGNNSTFGTNYLYRIRLKTGQTFPAKTSLNFSVTGPTGWNNDTASITTCELGAVAFARIHCTWSRAIVPISGNYRASVIYNNETFVSQPVAVDITAPTLERPNITVTQASTTAVTASWASITGVQSYYMRVLNDSDSTSNKQSPWLKTTNATISGLSLDPTKNPSVFVYAFNFDADNMGSIVFPTNAEMSSTGKAITIPTP
jgi:hypothetical protein